MKKKSINSGKLKLNKKIITQFESQKISGGCPTAEQYCRTEDWVCNHTNPDRCEGEGQENRRRL